MSELPTKLIHPDGAVFDGIQWNRWKENLPYCPDFLILAAQLGDDQIPTEYFLASEQGRALFASDYGQLDPDYWAATDLPVDSGIRTVEVHPA